MPLSNTAIRTTKPDIKPRKLYDERGLFILLSPKGGKWWRFKYRFDGKEKLLSLGVYPDVSLKQARERRDDARKLVADGVDPGEHRKAIKATRADSLENSFEVLAREWFSKYSINWGADHCQRVLRRLERDIFPWIGKNPVGEVTAPELLKVLQRIENRGALETAHRALSDCGEIMRFAIATGRAEHDLSGDLRGALPPSRGKNLAAVTDPEQVAEMLRAMDGYKGTLMVRCALRLAPLVFVRPGELRKAEWKDIDLDTAEWRFIVTKTGTQHIVPLSRQAVETLQELYPLTGDGRYVFPSVRTSERPMSDNTILAAMRRMGIGKEEMSGHGFRAMARTILDEVLGVRPDFIEHQLAHAVRDPNGRAYNRTAHLPERKKMMQQWADYLDKLKAGVEVIPLSRET
jgi:integrase